MIEIAEIEFYSPQDRIELIRNLLASKIAGDGIRTRDPNLGKVVLYQLSYSRGTGIFSKPC